MQEKYWSNWWSLLPAQREWISMLIVNVNKKFLNVIEFLHRQRVSTCPGKFAFFYTHGQMTLLYKHWCKLIVATKFATFYFVLLWSKSNQAVKFSSILVKKAMLFLLLLFFCWWRIALFYPIYFVSPKLTFYWLTS